MASVAENISILQSVFAPAANSLAEYNRGRLALAQANVRRAQELQDQQTASNLQRELNNARIGADDRRTEMAIRKQQLADDARFRQAMAVANEAEERQNAKLRADEAKATRAAVRKLYQDYADAGGKKKLSEFGAEDSIDTFYALQGEVGPLARKNSLDAFAGQARLLREQEKALRDSVGITKDEDAEIVGGALQALMTDERAADGVEFYNNAIAKGRSPEAALDAMRKKYPAAGQALDAMVSSLRSAKIAEKTSAPSFKIGVEQIGRLRSDLAKRAWDEKLGPDSFGMLFDQPTATATTPAAPAGGSLGAFTPPKPDATATPTRGFVDRAATPQLYGDDPLIASVNQRRKTESDIADYQARARTFNVEMDKLESLKSKIEAIRGGRRLGLYGQPIEPSDYRATPMLGQSDQLEDRAAQLSSLLAIMEQQKASAEKARRAMLGLP